MNKKLTSVIIAAFLTASMLLSGCSGQTASSASPAANTTANTTAKASQANVSNTSVNKSASAKGTVTKYTDDDTGSTEWSNTGTITLGGTVSFTGKGISASGTKVTITAGGDYTITGKLSSGMIYVDTAEKVKLRLNGVDITNPDGPAIFVSNAKKAYIVLTDGTKNTLTDGSKYTVEAKGALFSNDTLEIKGNGALNVNGNYKHGIASDDDIIIAGGTMNVKSVTDGLHANTNISTFGGNLNITSSSDAIESEGDVVINAGNFSITAGDDGIHSETELTINGGDIKIAKSYEGIEGKTAIVINDGNIRIAAEDDALNAGNAITVNGGYIYADCNGDGFDSNCDMAINGGTTVVYSGNNANGPLDIGDNAGSFTINGGTIIAAGGNMGISVNENSKQYSMWINSQIAANTLVNLAAQSGDEIVTFAPVKGCSLIYYSSDKLSANAVCTISTGGSYSGKAVDGVYSGGSYKSGTKLGTVTMSSKSASYGNQMMGGGGKGGKMGDPGNGSGQRMTPPDGANGKSMTPPDGDNGRSMAPPDGTNGQPSKPSEGGSSSQAQ